MPQKTQEMDFDEANILKDDTFVTLQLQYHPNANEHTLHAGLEIY